MASVEVLTIAEFKEVRFLGAGPRLLVRDGRNLVQLGMGECWAGSC